MGYYGDIYMKQFIKICKKKTKENIQRRKDIVNANNLLEMTQIYYIKHNIVEYL